MGNPMERFHFHVFKRWESRLYLFARSRDIYMSDVFHPSFYSESRVGQPIDFARTRYPGFRTLFFSRREGTCNRGKQKCKNQSCHNSASSSGVFSMLSESSSRSRTNRLSNLFVIHNRGVLRIDQDLIKRGSITRG